MTAGSSVVYNWTYSTFRCHKKRRHDRSVPSRPFTDRGEIEATSVIHAKAEHSRVSSRSDNVWENGGRKTCFRSITKDNGYGRARLSGKLNFLFIHLLTYFITILVRLFQLCFRARALWGSCLWLQHGLGTVCLHRPGLPHH